MSEAPISSEAQTADGRANSRYIALGTAAVAAVVAVLAAVFAGPTVAAVVGPLGVLVVSVAVSFARRHDVDRADERAKMVTMTAKATSFDALLGLLVGTMIYQWIAHGRAAAEPVLYVVVAGSIIFAVIHAVQRRRA